MQIALRADLAVMCAHCIVGKDLFKSGTAHGLDHQRHNLIDLFRVDLDRIPHDQPGQTRRCSEEHSSDRAPIVRADGELDDCRDDCHCSSFSHIDSAEDRRRRRTPIHRTPMVRRDILHRTVPDAAESRNDTTDTP